MKLFFNHRLSRTTLTNVRVGRARTPYPPNASSREAGAMRSAAPQWLIAMWFLSMILVSFSALTVKAEHSEVINKITWRGWVNTPRADIAGCSVPDNYSGLVTVPLKLGNFEVKYLSCLRTITSAQPLKYSYEPFEIKSKEPIDLVLPKGVRIYSFGGSWGLFRNCKKLASVTIPSDFSFYDQYEGAMPYTVNNRMFQGCTELTNVVADKMTFTLLTTNMFNGCTKLSTAIFSEKIKGVGNNAFSGCTALSSVTFAGSVPNGISSAGIRNAAWINISTNYYAKWKATKLHIIATNPILNPFDAIKLRNRLQDHLSGITNVISRTSEDKLKKIMSGTLVPITRRVAEVLYIDDAGNTYVVKFHANGGTGTMADEPFTYGTAKALSANVFTRVGYVFSGWATSASDAKVYCDKQSVSNLTTTVNGTYDLYAVWEQVPPSSVEIHAGSRYPWNGLVDIHFTITGTSGMTYDTTFTAKDMVGNTNILMRTVRKSDGTAANVEGEALQPGTYHWVWDAAADLPDGFQCERVTVEVTAE